MIKAIELSFNPQQAVDDEFVKSAIASHLQIHSSNISEVQMIKKSIDARKSNIKINIRFNVFIDEKAINQLNYTDSFPDVTSAQSVIIVGAGPGGLFAALKLIELGLKPIVLERGKDVHSRKIDIAAVNRNLSVNNESNYCFGEGGAGAFSDGKLYTRSNKRGNIQSILELLVIHGADESILYEAHPHIGTDKLPIVIENIRKTIISHGGSFVFNCNVSSFIIKNKKIKGVIDSNKNIYNADNIIIATGHSARDIFTLFKEQKLKIEPKPLAIGLRVEHPQILINNIQYHASKDIKYLPNASYNLVNQVDGRGVFSFCMCPGGTIVPASTEAGEVVVNGMSNAKRNSPFANSGMVVQINYEDIKEYHKFDDFAFLEFQKDIEQAAYHKVGNVVEAPAQRMNDFVNKKSSFNLVETSYFPGVKSANLHDILPSFISEKLRKGFQHWGKTMPGFLTNEAMLLGVESRTSSPIRITRNPESLEHIEIKGLYPCGEGAGYAGGIVSSAMDGVRIAEKIAGAIK
ncbi:MAG: FAD-dependent oxidoreductase [Bacteroidota bacterium]